MAQQYQRLCWYDSVQSLGVCHCSATQHHSLSILTRKFGYFLLTRCLSRFTLRLLRRKGILVELMLYCGVFMKSPFEAVSAGRPSLLKAYDPEVLRLQPLSGVFVGAGFLSSSVAAPVHSSDPPLDTLYVDHC